MARWDETEINAADQAARGNHGLADDDAIGRSPVHLDGLLEIGAADIDDLGGHAGNARQVAEMFLGQDLLSLFFFRLRLDLDGLGIGNLLAQALVFPFQGLVIHRPVNEIARRLQRGVHTRLNGVGNFVSVRAGLGEDATVAAAVAQSHQGHAEQHQHKQQEPAPRSLRSSHLLRPPYRELVMSTSDKTPSCSRH